MSRRERSQLAGPSLAQHPYVSRPHTSLPNRPRRQQSIRVFTGVGERRFDCTVHLSYAVHCTMVHGVATGLSVPPFPSHPSHPLPSPRPSSAKPWQNSSPPLQIPSITLLRTYIVHSLSLFSL